MALDGIQWRFQNPVEFKHLNDQMENNKEGWKNAALLGIAGHDYGLDAEAANLIESQTKQKEIDASNQEQLKKEVSLLQGEIAKLEKRNEEIKVEIQKIQAEKEKYLASLQPAENDGVDPNTKLAMNGWNSALDTSKANAEVPSLGSPEAVQYQNNMVLGGV